MYTACHLQAVTLLRRYIGSLGSTASNRVSLGSVDVTSLDAWWDAHGRNEKITILKVDCEGKDPDVLLGAEGLISQGLVDYIFWEYSQFWYYFGLAAACKLSVASCALSLCTVWQVDDAGE